MVDWTALLLRTISVHSLSHSCFRAFTARAMTAGDWANMSNVQLIGCSCCCCCCGCCCCGCSCGCCCGCGCGCCCGWLAVTSVYDRLRLWDRLRWRDFDFAEAEAEEAAAKKHNKVKQLQQEIIIFISVDDDVVYCIVSWGYDMRECECFLKFKRWGYTSVPCYNGRVFHQQYCYMFLSDLQSGVKDKTSPLDSWTMFMIFSTQNLYFLFYHLPLSKVYIYNK